MKKYIFFIDIDGTLLKPHTREIEQNIVSEILRLKAQGHIFVVATGRVAESVFNIKNIEVFDYISSLIGLIIYKLPEKEVIFKDSPLDVNEVKKITEYLNSIHCPWSYKDDFGQKTIFDEKGYLSNISSVCKVVKEEQFFKDLKDKKIMQLLIGKHLTEEEKQKFSYFNCFNMPNSYCDATRKGITKANVLKYFKENLSGYESVAIGDAENDMAMLDAADVSIAMGNAEEKVKKHAKFVTKDINDDGLVFAFKNILKL